MNKNIPIFILAGGMGTRLKEETELKPKPMINIGEKPILMHIMNKYAIHGFKKFIICTGFKSEIIKSYFLNFSTLNSDFSINLVNNEMSVHSVGHNLDWEVTLAFTGEKNMTGSRIAIAAEKYLGINEVFGVTYGDGLTDADLNDEYLFHLNNGSTGTILGVNPPSRFGELQINGNDVIAFKEKPSFSNEWINGGYFFFKKKFIDYLDKKDNCILEKEPLVKLAADKGLKIYKHKGFWACMDTQRDKDYLTGLYKEGKASWLK